MWRNYVICVLIGLLLVSTGGNVVLMRQVLSAQADTERLRQRLVAAESAQNSVQQQLDQLKVAAAATPSARPTPAPAPASQNTTSGQTPATGSPPQKFEQFCQENAGAC
jgi:hypothetical protein